MAHVEIYEVDDNGGTGRSKDERTERIELADFTVRDTDLDQLKDKLQKHVDLV